MGGKSANLGKEIFPLALVGRLELRHRVALLEDIGQAFDRRQLPLPQHRGGHPVLGRELVQRLRFLEEL